MTDLGLQADAKRVATTAAGTTTTVTPAPDVISSMARLQKIQKRLGWSTSLLNRYTEHHQFDNDEVGDEEGGDEAAAAVDHAVLLGVSETEAAWDVTTAVEQGRINKDGHDEVGDGDGATQDGGDEVVLDIGTEASGDAATTAGGSYDDDGDAEAPVAVAPDGWREVVDPESGSTYFFNDATELSQWDCPPELGGADIDMDAAMDAAMPDAGMDTEMDTSLESAADDSAADDSVLSRSLRIAEIEETARSLANAHFKDVAAMDTSLESIAADDSAADDSVLSRSLRIAEMDTSLESTAADDSAADDSVLSRSLRIAEIEETARSLANAHLKDVAAASP